MIDGKKLLQSLERVKYPLLVLLIGVGILLLPGEKRQEDASTDCGDLLRQILSSAEGIGRVCVLVSENGVVVVCDGADNARVRLDVIRAVGAYTGFLSDRITILKMADSRDGGS